MAVLKPVEVFENISFQPSSAVLKSKSTLFFLGFFYYYFAKDKDNTQVSYVFSLGAYHSLGSMSYQVGAARISYLIFQH